MAAVKYLLFLIPLCLFGLGSLHAREFSVVTYNVENLFDVDEVAVYSDYRADRPDEPFAYSREKLWTKLDNITRVLAKVNDGAGPEVILFNELEGDFTPESGAGEDKAAFLDEFADTTVEAMLGEEWKPEYAGYSAADWLLKAMADAGMTGYEVAVAPAKPEEDVVAHVNALFSRFPIEQVEFHPIEQARDILEARLDVDDEPLWIYGNHWKSGASNPDRERIRLENARVLREELDARLAADPSADVVVAGDLNSHYNHDLLFPEIETGINDVLGAQGDETFGDDADLYNLWFELPPADRYSEVWRGRRGSLMHLIVSPGLYDDSGISYVDESFEVLKYPGLNADQIGRPLSWSFAGRTGGGFSDHFPIMARFSTRPFERTAPPSEGDDALDYEMPLGYSEEQDLDLEAGDFLGGIGDAELGPYVGKLYAVEARVVQAEPIRLKVGDDRWSAYSFDPSIREALREAVGAERELNLVVSLGIWKDRRQFIVEGIR
ncbi:MAG: endonuclease/exonuclease/phosphatase family protein, partial [Verrucomicrobiota bacterium]